MLFSGAGFPAARAEPAEFEVRRATAVTSCTSDPLPRFGFPGSDLATWLQAATHRASPLPAVMKAVVAGDDESLERLLTAGAPADEVTPAGDTALCAAVRLGELDCVRLLLAHGTDVRQTGAEGLSPLVLASLRRGTAMLELLLEAGADPNERIQSPVDRALLNRLTNDSLRQLLASDRGVTVLMACTARGDVEATSTLLRHGARPSLHTQRFARYPINIAAEQGFLFLMRVLLGRPPDAEPDLLIRVSLSQQRVWLFKHGEVIMTTRTSTGRKGYDTPPGRYVITDKHREWTSTLYHVSMPWFMRLNCSAIGLHGGYVTGRPASHGCIRLPEDAARKFFEKVLPGDEVEIVE